MSKCCSDDVVFGDGFSGYFSDHDGYLWERVVGSDSYSAEVLTINLNKEIGYRHLLHAFLTRLHLGFGFFGSLGLFHVFLLSVLSCWWFRLSC